MIAALRCPIPSCGSTDVLDQRTDGLGCCCVNCAHEGEGEEFERPEREPPVSDVEGSQVRPRAVTVRLDAVEPERVSWLWSGRIPRRKLTLIEGDPGCGKTWLTLAVAAARSRGTPLPGEIEPELPADSLLLTYEDGMADTVRPRVDALGGDPSRIHAVTGWRSVAGEDKGQLGAAQLDMLEEVIERLRPALLVIDPIQAFLGAGTDMHRANEVRPLLAALGALAERYDLAAVAIRHLRKSSSDHAIHRGLGSIDFAAAARSVLLVGRDPDREDDPHARILAQVKSSLGPLAASLGFSLAEGAFAWRGESRRSAAELLVAPATPEERGRSAEAELFLREALSAGPRRAGEVIAEAQAVGIAGRTLQSARRAIGVTTTRQADGWRWEVPGGQGAEGAQEAPWRIGALAPCSETGSKALPTNQPAKAPTPARESALEVS